MILLSKLVKKFFSYILILFCISIFSGCPKKILPDFIPGPDLNKIAKER